MRDIVSVGTYYNFSFDWNCSDGTVMHCFADANVTSHINRDIGQPIRSASSVYKINLRGYKGGNLVMSFQDTEIRADDYDNIVDAVFTGDYEGLCEIYKNIVKEIASERV